MGFANPIQPIDYERIEQSVEDGYIDYDRVRQACDVALQSTDTAIANLSTQVGTRAAASALQAARDEIAAVKAVADALATATATNATLIKQRQPSPVIAAWTATRNDTLAALAAIELAIRAVAAERAANLDTSAEGNAVVAALNARRTQLYAAVKIA